MNTPAYLAILTSKRPIQYMNIIRRPFTIKHLPKLIQKVYNRKRPKASFIKQREQIQVLIHTNWQTFLSAYMYQECVTDKNIFTVLTFISAYFLVNIQLFIWFQRK